MKAICILISTCFILSFNTSKAQLLDSLTLDTTYAYTDLAEALKNPNAVIKLSLRKSHLKSFPNEILQFKNLQYLDLSKNTIKELSDSIDQLVHLQYLIVSKTGLMTLTKSIGKLTHLKYLNLNQNELEYLPPQIGNLEELEYLDLWSNNFNEYPSTFANLRSLRSMDLRNILISDETQNSIKDLVPKATVFMSPSCKCKW